MKSFWCQPTTFCVWVVLLPSVGFLPPVLILLFWVKPPTICLGWKVWLIRFQTSKPRLPFSKWRLNRSSRRCRNWWRAIWVDIWFWLFGFAYTCCAVCSFPWIRWSYFLWNNCLDVQNIQNSLKSNKGCRKNIENNLEDFCFFSQDWENVQVCSGEFQNISGQCQNKWIGLYVMLFGFVYLYLERLVRERVRKGGRKYRMT